MVIDYVRYHVPAERMAEFEEAYRRHAKELAASPRCVDFELTRDTGDPSRLLLRVRWTTADDLPEDPAGEFVEERSRHRPTPVRGQGGSVPTIYQWAGGSEALERLTEVFYGHVKNDDVIGPIFAHMDPSHPRYVAMWLGEVFGGPDGYTRERGGYAHMLGQHVGKAITERQRRRWIALLLDAADEVGLPADPEFRAAFVGYIEWGTRLAFANSQPDAKPFQQAPVPRWGWGVAPPYLG
ncbi:globin domain-containing protein [Streptosporangium soli]|nr:antibiotic biosynthesis monooxygenase [Streptosporangium sp. KLBMP 9127]